MAAINHDTLACCVSLVEKGLYSMVFRSISGPVGKT